MSLESFFNVRSLANIYFVPFRIVNCAYMNHVRIRVRQLADLPAEPCPTECHRSFGRVWAASTMLRVVRPTVCEPNGLGILRLYTSEGLFEASRGRCGVTFAL